MCETAPLERTRTAQALHEAHPEPIAEHAVRSRDIKEEPR